MIEIRGLHVVFRTPRGPVHAVRGVDIDVSAGETVGIVGESGSGKSTIARTIVGLVKPTEGSVEIDGVPVKPLEGSASASDATKAQMVFQDPYSSLNPHLRPLAAVAEAIQVCRGLPKAQARDEAADLLGSVGLSTRQIGMKTRSLSGGQRQRVSLARALAPEPSILVADEPTSSLDQSIAASLLNLLRRLQEQRNLTVIFISHDLGVIRYVAQRVYVMKDGEIVEAGECGQVFEAPREPYTRRLIDATLLQNL